jgi:AcrR family transcriptional regulator
MTGRLIPPPAGQDGPVPAKERGPAKDRGPATGGPAEAARRGRPRSEEADRAILAAATELLAERGLAGMSIEEVAARAGVGKSTIYRRWPTRGALALDAFLAEFSSQLPAPDTGSLRSDLRAALRAWVRAVTKTRAGRMLAGLLAEAQRDPQLGAAWRERVMEPLRAAHRVIVERAAERGEIAPGTDPDLVLDLLFGPAYHRLLNRHRPLSDNFVRGVADLIMDGVAQRRPSDPTTTVGHT